MFSPRVNERLLCLSIVLLLMFFTFGSSMVSGQEPSPSSKDTVWTYFDIATDEIIITPDGVVWVAALGEVADYSRMVYFDGVSWSDVPHSEQLVGACWTHASLAAAPDGTVWLGSCSPNHFDGESWIVYRSSLGGGFYRNIEEYTVIVNDQDAPPSNGVAALATASDGSLWLAPDGAGIGGVLHFDGETWITYTVDDGLISNRVHTMAIAPDDSVWAGTSEGLSHFDGAVWTNYPQVTRLQSYSLEELAVTSDGMVWGTYGFSLFWFDGVEVITLDSPEILDARHVLALASAPDGTLWVGTNTGISKFDGENWTNYHPEGVNKRITFCITGFLPSLAIAPDGSVWYGTSCGIYRLMPPNN